MSPIERRAEQHQPGPDREPGRRAARMTWAPHCWSVHGCAERRERPGVVRRDAATGEDLGAGAQVVGQVHAREVRDDARPARAARWPGTPRGAAGSPRMLATGGAAAHRDVGTGQAGGGRPRWTLAAYRAQVDAVVRAGDCRSARDVERGWPPPRRGCTTIRTAPGPTNRRRPGPSSDRFVRAPQATRRERHRDPDQQSGSAIDRHR